MHLSVFVLFVFVTVVAGQTNFWELPLAPLSPSCGNTPGAFTRGEVTITVSDVLDNNGLRDGKHLFNDMVSNAQISFADDLYSVGRSYTDTTFRKVTVTSTKGKTVTVLGYQYVFGLALVLSGTGPLGGSTITLPVISNIEQFDAEGEFLYPLEWHFGQPTCATLSTSTTNNEAIIQPADATISCPTTAIPGWVWPVVGVLAALLGCACIAIAFLLVKPRRTIELSPEMMAMSPRLPFPGQTATTLSAYPTPSSPYMP